MTLTLDQLLHTIKDDIIALHGSPDVQITAPVEQSSLRLETGGVFVARKGLSVDGHDFIPQAIENGAAAIIGEHDIRDLSVPYVQVRDPQQSVGYLAAAYHDFPSRKLIVIGVTGTNGKTTTSTVIHHILQRISNGKAGYISTLAADLGDGLMDTGLHVSTPEAPEVQVYLARMVANELRYAVIEMTSHGLAQGRLNGVDIDVAVMTNITHEHLDFHGSFEAYRAAKVWMFEMLSKSYRKAEIPKIAIINRDDPNYAFFTQPPADKTTLYGLSEQADFRAVDIHYTPDETKFYVMDAYGKRSPPFRTKLNGAFNVSNCLAAIAVTLPLAGEYAPIVDAIQSVTAVSGRMERIDEGQDFIAVVDFAHTPDALEKALQAARTMIAEDGHLIAVFGSAGLRDVAKRRLMAEISTKLADFTVLTAEDPRTESLDDILQTMAEGCIAQGGAEGETFVRVRDRGEALYVACQRAKAGDVVIACGKGHEQSMCFGTIEYAWDDRDALRAALRGQPLKTLPTTQEA